MGKGAGIASDVGSRLGAFRVLPGFEDIIQEYIIVKSFTDDGEDSSQAVLHTNRVARGS